MNFEEGLTGERVSILVRVDHAGDALEVGAGLVAVTHCLNSLINHRLWRIGKLEDQEDLLERGLLLLALALLLDEVVTGHLGSILVDLVFAFFVGLIDDSRRSDWVHSQLSHELVAFFAAAAGAVVAILSCIFVVKLGRVVGLIRVMLVAKDFLFVSQVRELLAHS